mmetsp:Transcript_518/g.1000  ORF Transcript_518/g.1000 Transcript_518/m.1000 type:complete len:260 (-) Transcript_518:13-792(-)
MDSAITFSRIPASLNSTNPKPLDLPVRWFMTTVASCTAPNCSKCFRSSRSSTENARPPTKIPWPSVTPAELAGGDPPQVAKANAFAFSTAGLLRALGFCACPFGGSLASEDESSVLGGALGFASACHPSAMTGATLALFPGPSPATAGGRLEPIPGIAAFPGSAGSTSMTSSSRSTSRTSSSWGTKKPSSKICGGSALPPCKFSSNKRATCDAKSWTVRMLSGTWTILHCKSPSLYTGLQRKRSRMAPKTRRAACAWTR